MTPLARGSLVWLGAVLGSCTGTGADLPATEVRAEPSTGMLDVRLVREIAHTTYEPWEAALCLVSDRDGDGKRDIAFLPSMMADAVYVYSLGAGTRLATLAAIDRKDPHALAPRAMVDGGDLDGDLRPDLVVLRTERSDGDQPAADLSAWSMSGTQPIWQIQIQSRKHLEATSLARVADVNHDGCADLAVGLAPWNSSNVRGRLELYSGRDGKRLWSVEGAEAPFKFGSEVARCGDFDGDELDDMAVTVPYRARWEFEGGSRDPLTRIEIRSSADGLRLRTIERTRSSVLGIWMPPSLACTLRGGEDLNGDGVAELIMRSVLRDDSIEILNGKDGKPLTTLRETAADDDERVGYFGDDIAVTDDLDGDGWRDVLVGHKRVGDGNGRHGGAVYLYSSKSGRRLAAVFGDVARQDGLGCGVCWIGDDDGDGAPEFAVVGNGSIHVFAVRRR